MPIPHARWHQCSRPANPQEAAALEYLRNALPDHEPWRGYTGFRLVEKNGTAYDLDALIIGPRGVFVVEIKSLKGRLRALPGRWDYTLPSGVTEVRANPLALTETKAKVLKAALERAGVVTKNEKRTPYIDALVFLSEDASNVAFESGGELRVYVRDEQADVMARRFGVVAALTGARGPAQLGRNQLMREDARAIEDVLKPMLSERVFADRAGDWIVGERIGGTEACEDRLCTRAASAELRRLRIFTVGEKATERDRAGIRATRDREYEVLSTLVHASILRVLEKAEHDRGPALVFEAPTGAVGLETWLGSSPAPSLEKRFAVLRAVGEALTYAHGHHVLHRALQPRSVLVIDTPTRLSVRVLDWYCAAHVDGEFRPATHVGNWVGERDSVWLAPELALPGTHGERTDVWGLGVLAAFVFSGKRPAESPIELRAKLERDAGLRLAAMVEGVNERLDSIIFAATQRSPGERTASVAELLKQLEQAERNATIHTDAGDILDPRVDDIFDARFKVISRVGSGSTALGVRVRDLENDDDGVVLKIALHDDAGRRLVAESAALAKFKHPNIVRLRERRTIAGHETLVLDYAGESLAERLRRETRLSLDDLERFGRDLCNALIELEQVGVLHRDIKPDNLGVAENPGTRRRQLVLFDFSLAAARPDETGVGTIGYRDPFLGADRRLVADAAADRYSAAVTLYEMATGKLPRWGDTDPRVVPTAQALIDTAAFDPIAAPALALFFERAFRRLAAERYHTGIELRDAWSDAFAAARETTRPRDLRLSLKTAALDTPIGELGVSAYVREWLEREQIITVADALNAPHGIRGKNTGLRQSMREERNELLDAIRERFATTTSVGDTSPRDYRLAHIGELARAYCDVVVEPSARALLNLDDALPALPWPSHRALAGLLDVDVADIAAAFVLATDQWRRKDRVKQLRAVVLELVRDADGIITDEDLGDALTYRNGNSSNDRATRVRQAAAVARVITECTPELVLHRPTGHGSVFVALREGSPISPDVLLALGSVADLLVEHSDYLPGASAASRLVSSIGAQRDIRPSRVVALAAAASRTAVRTADGGLRRRDLSPARALQLARIVVGSHSRYSPQRLGELVALRFPGIVMPTDAIEVEALVKEAGLPLVLRTPDGEQAFIADVDATGSTRLTRMLTPTTAGSLANGPRVQLAHETLDAHARRGGWCVIVVSTRAPNEPALLELCKRHSLERVDLDGLIVAAFRDFAAQHTPPVQFAKLDEAFVAPAGSVDALRFANVLVQVRPMVAERLRALPARVLLVNPGLFERLGWSALLTDLHRRAGTAEGPQLAWLVVPRLGDREPIMIHERAPSAGPIDQFELKLSSRDAKND